MIVHTILDNGYLTQYNASLCCLDRVKAILI